VGKLSPYVSRMQCSVSAKRERCIADPGPLRVWYGPGSAVHHFVLHRARDTWGAFVR